MGLSKEPIEEFRLIWEEKSCEEISAQEAYKSVFGLVTLFDLLAKFGYEDRKKVRINETPK